MDGEELGVRTVELDDSYLVSLRGELDARGAERVAGALAFPAGTHVVLDLSGLTLMDAGGLSAVLAARQAILAGGGSLAIRGAHGLVRRVFEVTGLGTLLDR